MRYGHGLAGRQIALWAFLLTLEHPTRHEKLTFTARPPREGVWTKFGDEIDALFEELSCEKMQENPAAH